MDQLIKEHLEALLQENSSSKRLGRRIISLAGFLGPRETPDGIRKQLSYLSRLLVRQDAFDAMLDPVMALVRSSQTANIEPQAALVLLNSLEEARKGLVSDEEVNYSELIGWLVGIARSRKILRIKGL
jgi:hypothetical protein